MKKIASKVLLVTAIVALWSLDFAPDGSYMPSLVNTAHAVIGRPLSPVSVAGVSRRSTRRAVAATAAQPQPAQPQEVQPEAQPAEAQPEEAQPEEAQPAPEAASALAAGTVVSVLPPGCTSLTVEGVSLFNCGGVMYQPKFENDNLVYVVK